MIIPAIIPKSLSDLAVKLELLSFAQSVQIDVVDGEFVSDISWPYEPQGTPSEASELLAAKQFEVDLMAYEAIGAGQLWDKAGAAKLIFHLESLKNCDDIFKLKEQLSCEIGLSLNNDTSLEYIYPYITTIDFVQLMGIAKIGSQGQPYDERVLERIKDLRKLFPELVISIDGGVNENSILDMKKFGANRFVVGSNILKSSDPEAQYSKLLKIVSE